jgi:hypothetical protein
MVRRMMKQEKVVVIDIGSVGGRMACFQHGLRFIYNANIANNAR